MLTSNIHKHVSNVWTSHSNLSTAVPRWRLFRNHVIPLAYDIIILDVLSTLQGSQSQHLYSWSYGKQHFLSRRLNMVKNLNNLISHSASHTGGSKHVDRPAQLLCNVNICCLIMKPLWSLRSKKHVHRDFPWWLFENLLEKWPLWKVSTEEIIFLVKSSSCSHTILCWNGCDSCYKFCQSNNKHVVVL